MFPLEYAGYIGNRAIHALLQKEYDISIFEFDREGVTNFVDRFCKEGNVLSQWPGYADDGKGFLMGFSIEELQNYCVRYSEIITFEKVQYKMLNDLDDIIEKNAIFIINQLKSMRH